MLPGDTNRKPAVSIITVLLPFMSKLLTLPRTYILKEDPTSVLGIRVLFYAPTAE
jgi:hypothetical protein